MKMKKILSGLLGFAIFASTMPMAMAGTASPTVGRSSGGVGENEEHYWFKADFNDGILPAGFEKQTAASSWTQSVEDGAMKLTYTPSEAYTASASLNLMDIVLNSEGCGWWQNKRTQAAYEKYPAKAVEFGFKFKLDQNSALKIPALLRTLGTACGGNEFVQGLKFENNTITANNKTNTADSVTGLNTSDFVDVKIYILPRQAAHTYDMTLTVSDGTTSKVLWGDKKTITDAWNDQSRVCLEKAVLTVDETTAVAGESLYFDDIYFKTFSVPHYNVVYKYNDEGATPDKLVEVAKEYPNYSAVSEEKNGKKAEWVMTDGNVFTSSDDISGLVDNNDTLTLTANWVKLNYITLKDKDADGNWTDVSTLRTTTDSIILPVRPTKNGKAFDGWYTDEELTTKFTGTGITDNMNVYAGYRNDDYVMYVDFENNTYPQGFNTEKFITSQYQRWTNAIEKDADSDNHRMVYTVDRTKPFNGNTAQNLWSTNFADFVGKNNALLAGKSVEMGVTVDVGDGYVNFGKLNPITAGDGWGDTINHQRNSYGVTQGATILRFNQWGGKTVDAAKIIGPITLTYTVDFKANGDMDNSTKTIRVQYQTASGAVDTTMKSSYGRGGVLTSFATEAAADYAVYTEGGAMPKTGKVSIDNIYIKTVSQNTLTFNTNGGELPAGTAGSAAKAGAWKIESLPTPVKRDSKFMGWWTSDGTQTGEWGTEVKLNDTVDKDMTIYAKWEIGYTISLMDTADENETPTDGNFVLDSTIIVGEGETAKLPLLPTKDGKIFAGWYLDKEYNNVFDGTNITTSIPVYAKYGNDDGYLLWIDFENNTYPQGFNTPKIAEENQRWTNELVTVDGNTVMKYHVDRTKPFAKDAAGNGIYQTIWYQRLDDIFPPELRKNRIVEMGYTMDFGDARYASKGNDATNQAFSPIAPAGLNASPAWGWALGNRYGSPTLTFDNAIGDIQNFNPANKGPINIAYQIKFDESGKPVGSSKKISISYVDEDGSTKTMLGDMNAWTRDGWILSNAGEAPKDAYVYDQDKADSDPNYTLAPESEVTLDNLYIKELATNTLRYDVQGGTLPAGSSESYVGAGSYYAPKLPVPTKENYVFRGWYTDPACTEGNEFESGDLVENDMTIYAKWVQGVTITLYDINADGTGWTEYKKIEAETGDEITLPTLPTKNGKVFEGWYKDEEYSEVFGGVGIEHDMPIYAKYRDDDYLIYVDFENNTYPEGFNTPEVSAGAAFQRWSSRLIKDENGNAAMQYTVDRTKPFDGNNQQQVWNVNFANVLSKTARANKIIKFIYNIDFGDGIYSTATNTFVPIGLGDGWGYAMSNNDYSRGINTLRYPDAAGEIPYINSNTVKGPMEIEFEVAFNSNGTPIGSSKTLTVTYTDINDEKHTVTSDLNDNARDGDIASWVREAANTAFVYDSDKADTDASYVLAGKEEGSITLYKLYAVEVKTIKLNYDANGGELPKGTSSTYVNREEFVVPSLPIPTKSGYAFAGWYYDSECTNEVNQTDVISEDTTIYAKWAESNTIVFMDKDADGNWVEVKRLEVEKGKDAILPTLSTGSSGKAFKCWYKSDDFSTEDNIFDGTNLQDGVTTVYAAYRSGYLFYADFENNTYPTGFNVGKATKGINYQRWTNTLKTEDFGNTVMQYNVDRSKLFDADYSQTLWDVYGLVPKALLAEKTVEMGMTVNLGDGMSNLDIKTFNFGTNMWGHPEIMNGSQYYNGSITTTVFPTGSGVNNDDIKSPITFKYILSFDKNGDVIGAGRKVTYSYTDASGAEITRVVDIPGGCSTGDMRTNAVEKSDERFVYSQDLADSNPDYWLIDKEFGTLEIDDVYVKEIGEESKVTLTFDPAGGTLGTGEDTISNVGGIILGETLPEPVRDGYTFMGWYFRNDNGGYAQKLKPKASITATATVYAVWQSAPTVVAHTPEENETVLTASSTITVEFDSVMNDSSLTNQSFEIWKLSADGNTQTAPGNYTVTMAVNPETLHTTATVTLNGKWEPGVSYKVIVKGGENGVANAHGVMTVDKEFTFKTKPMVLFVSDVQMYADGVNVTGFSLGSGKTLTIKYKVVNEELAQINPTAFNMLTESGSDD